MTLKGLETQGEKWGLRLQKQGQWRSTISLAILCEKDPVKSTVCFQLCIFVHPQNQHHCGK